MLLLATAGMLPLYAAGHYEELAQKLLTHIPQQAAPVRVAVQDFTFPEDKKGLPSAEDVKDELEVELGRDSRVQLVSGMGIGAQGNGQGSSPGGAMANPDTQAGQSRVDGVDALVRGRVSLRENGEICIFAELMQVADGTISKEKVSWMPAAAQPATAPEQQPVYQPAPQPVYQPAPVQYTSTEDRSDLQPLLNRMAALRCKHASSAEQQRHLLQLLPMIRDGAPVDVVALDDPYDRTALHYSCAIGSLSITRWLVNHGANVNATDVNGRTPLSMVGADNRTAITNLLLQNGASYSGGGGTLYVPPDSGNLQTHINRISTMPVSNETFALYRKRLLMLLPMIQNGANVNTTTVETKGNTALHYACGLGDYVLVQWLLQHGANPNAVTDKGKRPSQCSFSDTVQRLLKQYGGY